MISDMWITGHRVELPEMLAGRERRAQHQQELRDTYGGTLVCFTLNIAGPVKVFPLSEEMFLRTVEEIQKALCRDGCLIQTAEISPRPCGWEAYFAVDAPAEEVKQRLLVLEESREAGRLYDIDVLREDGSKVSREEFGLPPRSCLICGRETIACARSRAHTVEDLQRKTAEIFLREVGGQPLSPEMIGRLCRQAMLLEVYTTPKPGLVDRNNNGAHRDMDVALFEKSTMTLEPYFAAMAREGIRRRDLAAEELLSVIRPIGIRAEEAMFRATSGVNTHKGMIFSLGILAAAAGRLSGREAGRNGKAEAGSAEMIAGEDIPGRLLALAGEIAAPAWEKDFAQMEMQEHEMTCGESQFRQYGIGGIRQEAAMGFPSVRDLCWPALSARLDRGEKAVTAGAFALLPLLAEVVDTNMVHRSSVEEAAEIRRRIRELLKSGDVTEDTIRELDEEFIRRNISPGGCADLLALTYFVYEMRELSRPKQT